MTASPDRAEARPAGHRFRKIKMAVDKPAAAEV